MTCIVHEAGDGREAPEMTQRPFRFGVVATPQGGGERWRDTARRVEELGYSTLLMPDVLQLLAPFPSLAVVAATTQLRVGTFVLASPLRAPLAAAWEAHSMGVLTDGRFELGIGTGRPGVKEAAQRLGRPYGSADERLHVVAETIEQLRSLDGDDRHTPVLVAAGGPKSMALAAAKADIVTLATGALAPQERVAAMVRELRAQAGQRAAHLELATNLFIVGDHVPADAERYIGADADALIAADSLAMLRGSVTEMVDELRRRRDALDFSYVAVNVAFMDQLAPVVERLTGQ
jgi:probable F420-dependent oxidoreductase